MSWFEALILGLIQGLTEFLPVSSSGHLEIGKTLLGVNVAEDLTFTVVVHAATVLSTLFVFRNVIAKLLGGLFRFRWNEETQYITKIAISMIPVAIVGLFFKDQVEQLFGEGLVVVGGALLVTAIFLTFAQYAKPRERQLGYWDALFIGIGQAIAVTPGLSRSGTTIATGLILGNKKSEVAQFSFLMVIVPILGESILDLLDGGMVSAGVGITPLCVGFLAAFVSGLFACKAMVALVKRGKLVYFAIYCGLVGALALIFG